MGDIEELYKEFQSEINAACWSFYAWKNIKDIAVDDKIVYRALNRNALSWNIILYSLQSTFFIAIGRLFDIDGKTFSVHTFLRRVLKTSINLVKMHYEREQQKVLKQINYLGLMNL